MKVSVKDCLQLEAFRKCIVVAGEKHMDRRVKAVSVMDAATATVSEKQTTQPVDKAVTRAADEAGLPLIIMVDGENMDYSQIIAEVMEHVLYGNNFKNSLINNTIFHLLNFEKHANFQQALREAAINNDFQVQPDLRDRNAASDHNQRGDPPREGSGAEPQQHLQSDRDRRGADLLGPGTHQ